MQTSGKRRVLAGRRRRHRLLRRDGRAPVRGQLPHRPHPLGLRHGRPDQREPVRLGPPRLHLELRGRDRLPRPHDRARALDDVRQARRVPLGELLCEPVDGRRAHLLRRPLGQGCRARRRGRPTVWTDQVGGLGYTTPAIANGRVFVGGFDGRLRAFRSTNGAELWSTYVGGKILGAPFVAGNHVFFSTLEKRTYAAARDGRRDRLAPPDGPLLAGNRDRADVLLLAERPPDRISRPQRHGFLGFARGDARDSRAWSPWAPSCTSARCASAGRRARGAQPRRTNHESSTLV